jgi:hypothetical protein
MQSSFLGNKNVKRSALPAGSASLSQRTTSSQRSIPKGTPICVANKISTSAHSSISSVQQRSASSTETSRKIKNKRLAIEEDSDDDSTGQGNEGNVIRSEKRYENANASHSASLSAVSKQLALSSSKKLRRSSLTHHDTPIDEEASESLVDRVKRLELELTILKNQFNRTHMSRIESIETLPEFGPFENTCIGKLVREDMFKAIKFLDAVTVKNQGPTIFKRFCEVSHQPAETESNTHVYDTVIRYAKKALNIHKCHVKQKVRKASLGKSALAIIMK